MKKQNGVILINWSVSFAQLKIVSDPQVHPNKLGTLEVENGTVGVVVVAQSETDFALSKSALDRVLSALREGRIVQGFLILVRRVEKSHPPQFVNAMPVEEVAAIVSNMAERNGNYGPYWWLTENIKPPGSNEPF
jgi:hypothetical protein